MNNNPRNNRRRGRGNNRQQGRGEQINRIDSRARGNAPQLLEKYKKLAHDAHLNGDRVTAEYYLQFADHYFRVIADTRQRQDEQRQRRDERLPEDEDDYELGHDHHDFPSYDQPFRREERRPQEPVESEAEAEAEADDGVRGEQAYEPAGGNPFTRDNRVARGGLLPRSERGERGERRPEPREAPPEPRPSEEPLGFDPAALPPSIAEGIPGDEGEPIAPAPAPRRRARRPRPTAEDSGGGPLEAVNG